MYKFTLSILLCVFLFAQENRTISVNGTAKLWVTPDLLTISGAVKSIGLTVKEVRNQSDAVLDVMIKKLNRASVPKNQIQIHHFQQGKNVRYVRGEQISEGYFSSAQFQVKLSDFDLISKVMEILLQSNDIEIHGSAYSSTKEDEFKIQVIDLAIANAETKAKKMAEKLQMKLVQPLKIEEISAGFHSPMPMYAKSEMQMNDSMPAEIGTYAGQIAVDYRVHILFEMKMK